MNKIELLAPAKDIDKAKIAVLYGADAVYCGGTSFSLRSRASNFSNEDLKEICQFAHERGSKIFVTVNIVFHDEDFEGIIQYLKNLEAYGVDAIIVSSYYIMQLCKKVAPKMECHMSTQLSTVNTLAMEVLKDWGADRVVLGRECSMEQIKEMSKHCDIPMEAFIHGGMCSNYSGRCVLSNRMTLRDANRGGCAQSCRWNYHLYQDEEEITDDKHLLSMSSKDLRATAYIEEMIKANVASLKIEGRMKSEYYIAQVVRTYRHLIDEIYEKGHLEEDRIEYYNKELVKAENRPCDDGFLSGICDDSKHLYQAGEGATNDYVGRVKDYDNITGMALIETKNRIVKGDRLEMFGPKLENTDFENEVMMDQNKEEMEVANRPQDLIWIKVPCECTKDDMIRRIH